MKLSEIEFGLPFVFTNVNHLGQDYIGHIFIKGRDGDLVIYRWTTMMGTCPQTKKMDMPAMQEDTEVQLLKIPMNFAGFIH